MFDGDTEWTWYQHCIQVDIENDEGWKKAFQELCYFINDIIGVSYNGFNTNSLDVEWNCIGDEIEGEG